MLFQFKELSLGVNILKASYNMEMISFRRGASSEPEADSEKPVYTR